MVANRIVTLCVVAGCSIKRLVGFFWLLNVIDSVERSAKLSRDRKKLWLAGTSRNNLAEIQLAAKNPTLSVCSNHSLSGQPSRPYEKCDPDWVPSFNMGYLSHTGNTTGVERFNRRRRKTEF